MLRPIHGGCRFQVASLCPNASLDGWEEMHFGSVVLKARKIAESEHALAHPKHGLGFN